MCVGGCTGRSGVRHGRAAPAAAAPPHAPAPRARRAAGPVRPAEVPGLRPRTGRTAAGRLAARAGVGPAAPAGGPLQRLQGGPWGGGGTQPSRRLPARVGPHPPGLTRVAPAMPGPPDTSRRRTRAAHTGAHGPHTGPAVLQRGSGREGIRGVQGRCRWRVAAPGGGPRARCRGGAGGRRRRRGRLGGAMRAAARRRRGPGAAAAAPPPAAPRGPCPRAQNRLTHRPGSAPARPGPGARYNAAAIAQLSQRMHCSDYKDLVIMRILKNYRDYRDFRQARASRVRG
jgi:hypothetical protein